MINLGSLLGGGLCRHVDNDGSNLGQQPITMKSVRSNQKSIISGKVIDGDKNYSLHKSNIQIVGAFSEVTSKNTRN
jgi:hypothetical protein